MGLKSRKKNQHGYSYNDNLFAKKILINQYKKSPIGPIKYVIKRGKNTKNFEIENFKLSFTIQAPQNKFIAKKWHQNIIKNPVSENNSESCSIPK